MLRRSLLRVDHGLDGLLGLVHAAHRVVAADREVVAVERPLHRSRRVEDEQHVVPHLELQDLQRVDAPDRAVWAGRSPAIRKIRPDGQADPGSPGTRSIVGFVLMAFPSFAGPRSDRLCSPWPPHWLLGSISAPPIPAAARPAAGTMFVGVERVALVEVRARRAAASLRRAVLAVGRVDALEQHLQVAHGPVGRRVAGRGGALLEGRRALRGEDQPQVVGVVVGPARVGYQRPAHPQREGPVDGLAQQRRAVLEGEGLAWVVEHDAVAGPPDRVAARRRVVAQLEVAAGLALGAGREIQRRRRDAHVQGRRWVARSRQHGAPVGLAQIPLADLDPRLGRVVGHLAVTVVGGDLQLGGRRSGQREAEERHEHQRHQGQDQGEPCFGPRRSLIRLWIVHGLRSLLSLLGRRPALPTLPKDGRAPHWPM